MNSGFNSEEEFQYGFYDYYLYGYVPSGSPITITRNNKIYEIWKYKSPHSNCFSIFEIQKGLANGNAQLFEDGVLKMAWTMNKGKRVGEFIIYEKGVAICSTTWDWVERKLEIRWKANEKKKMVMIITSQKTGNIIYRGGYDENMNRCGYGVEYDSQTGKPIRSAYYKNDVIKHIYQEFLSETEMIQFRNTGCNNCIEFIAKSPEYIGGYCYDPDSCSYVRHGYGRIIDPATGCCRYESEWMKNEEVVGFRVNLQQGWYRKDVQKIEAMKEIADLYVLGDHSITLASSCIPNASFSTGEKGNEREDEESKRIQETLRKIRQREEIRKKNREQEDLRKKEAREKEKAERVLQVELASSFSVPNTIEQLVIVSGSHNMASKLSIKSLIHLKVIDIANRCFQRVKECVIEKLPNLTKVHIGDNTFTQTEIFSIKDCIRLERVTLDQDVLSKACDFTLQNLAKLQTLSVGANSLIYLPQLTLQSLPELVSINLEKSVCKNILKAQFIDLPKLNQLKLGESALKGDDSISREVTTGANHYFKNELIMKKLPELSFLIGDKLALANIGIVILEDIPSIHRKGIQLAEDSFKLVYDLKVNSTSIGCSVHRLDVRRLGRYIGERITPSSTEQ